MEGESVIKGETYFPVPSTVPLNFSYVHVLIIQNYFRKLKVKSLNGLSEKLEGIKSTINFCLEDQTLKAKAHSSIMTLHIFWKQPPSWNQAGKYWELGIWYKTCSLKNEFALVFIVGRLKKFKT